MELAVVSSCCGSYGKYLEEWASSILKLTRAPSEVRLFTHGSEEVGRLGLAAIARLDAAGLPASWEHSAALLDLGSARNRAVAMSSSEWVMHLDCDDQIMPHALEDCAAIAPGADVIAMGYERSGDLAAGPTNRRRLYSSTTGLEALDAAAPCSGVSPFRRAFWERWPYRTNMLGAWDTSLWIGFARLGARFRPTRRPCFWYRQHADSIFNKRRKIIDWTHLLTVEQLKSLRRNDAGVAVIVPRASNGPKDREPLWQHVRAHYARAHPDWQLLEGFSPAASWSKGQAVADALSRSSAAVLVIADADCVIPPAALEAAVEEVASARAPWAVPHTRVIRLNKPRTAALLSGKPLPPLDEQRELARPPYTGYPGGGAFVVSRAVYEAAGGIPVAFRGWGAEDEALALILDTLAGRHWRGSADLVHLWHAPQPSKRLGSGNRPRYRQLQQAAAEGSDALVRALGMLASGVPLASAAQLRRDRLAGASASRRHSFLERRKLKAPPPGKPQPPRRRPP